jgi:hypothetical protein
MEEDTTEIYNITGSMYASSSDLISDDCITRSQYRDRCYRESPQHRAIKNLMLAVLNDALVCMYKCSLETATNAQHKLYFDTKTWMMDNDEQYVFSFVSICNSLNINYSSLRHRVLNAPLEDPFHYRRSPSMSSLLYDEEEEDGACQDS